MHTSQSYLTGFTIGIEQNSSVMVKAALFFSPVYRKTI